VVFHNSTQLNILNRTTNTPGPMAKTKWAVAVHAVA
jgi:hypothetical protein